MKLNAFFVLMLMTLVGCQAQQQAAPPMPQAMPVPVAHPIKKMITEWDEYTGRFDAVERVEIRARVSGYIDEVKFKDGQLVEEEQVLFVIDQRPFRIALDQAEAELKQVKAELVQAQNNFYRAEQLKTNSAISEEEFDGRQQSMLAIAARLEAAEAAVHQAELNLEFTEVKAPIAGRISRDFVNEGNLISGGTNDATLLTTIVSIAPIHFYFEASESELLKYIRLHKNGDRKGSRDVANPISVMLLDEQEYTHHGTMDFVDNQIDFSTGTMQGRAIFDNADHIIEPGMFGRARLQGSGEYEAILVPDTAIGTNQTVRFVYVVGPDNTAQPRPVVLGPLHEREYRIIKQGLTEEDMIITGNIQKIRPGSPVAPQVPSDPTAEKEETQS